VTATAFRPATTFVASDTIATTARHTGRRMWAVGAAAAVVASLIVAAVVAIAEAAGVPMEVAENSTKQPEQIPLLGYGTVILGSTLVGLLLATAFVRWVRRPKLVFVVTALVLTAVSFAFPATTTATTATKVVLELTHVIPAALIITAIASHLPSRRARRTGA
jgi:heme A synthase